jgi:hypothetical protein
MADVSQIRGKTSLLTASSVLALIFALSKFRKCPAVKRDGDKDGLGCPSLSFISSRLFSTGISSSSEY